MALLEFRFGQDDLTPAFENLPRSLQREVRGVIDATTRRAVQIAKFRTPVDRGRAIGNWRTSTEQGGARGVFSNDTPYIRVLEDGGYPVRPARFDTTGGGVRRGGAILGGLPPGPRTRRAPSGEPRMFDNVSKQAPRGMVRITLLEIEPQFVADLEEALSRAIAEQER